MFRASRNAPGTRRSFQFRLMIVSTDSLLLCGLLWECGGGDPVPMLSHNTEESLYPGTLERKWK